jgi:hypothetical protein
LVLSYYIELQDWFFQFQKIWLIMGLAWQAYGLAHLAKSIHGYYLVYRNFDNEMKTNRWFAKYETRSDRFGEQVSRIEFQGFDRLEDAQAFCEKNAVDVERTLRGEAGEFASPEQFAGVCVDIRSDLYSLGVVLWKMVTGHAVFRGSPAEVMYQHQHAPLPLHLLEAVSQPVVLLIKALLEKDPARRFQNPVELLKAMPTITGAIDSGCAITHESFQNVLVAASSVAAGRTPAGPGPAKISVVRLPVTGGALFGREEDIDFLDDAWADQDVNVVTIVAWAGVGKSTLVNHWLRRMAADRYRSAQLVFGWVLLHTEQQWGHFVRR